jgi:hypothetical protein
VINTLALIVPLYNEELSIKRFWLEAQASGVLHLVEQIIFVDDGSSDQSWSELEFVLNQDKRVVRIRHIENKGVGEAVRSGVIHSSTTHSCWMPIDLSYTFKDVLTRFPVGVEDPIILFKRNNSFGWDRKLLSFVFNAVSRFVFGCTIQGQSGMFIIRKEIFLNYMPITRRSISGSELIIRLIKSRLDIRIENIPCYPRLIGSSKVFSFKGVIQSAFQLFALLLLDPSLVRRSSKGFGNR